MDKILDYVRQHDEYRKGTLNLQASENVISPDVRTALASDLNPGLVYAHPGHLGCTDDDPNCPVDCSNCPFSKTPNT